jgi:hypothetical protein
MNNKNLIIICITVIIILLGIGILLIGTQANYNVEKMILNNDKGSAWVNVTDNFESINNGYMEKNGEQFTVVKAFDLNNKEDAQSLNNIVNVASKGEKFTDDAVEYYTVDYQALGNQINAFGITTLVLKNKEVNIGFMYDKDTNICVVIISSNFQHVEKMLKTVDFEINGKFHKGTQDLNFNYDTVIIKEETVNYNININTTNNNNNPQTLNQEKKAESYEAPNSPTSAYDLKKSSRNSTR